MSNHTSINLIITKKSDENIKKTMDASLIVYDFKSN